MRIVLGPVVAMLWACTGTLVDPPSVIGDAAARDANDSTLDGGALDERLDEAMDAAEELSVDGALDADAMVDVGAEDMRLDVAMDAPDMPLDVAVDMAPDLPPECEEPLADCDGDFTCESDLRSNPINCGSCGIACSGGELCRNGVCSVDCGGLMRCSVDGADRCIDLTSDREHCGGCGVECASAANGDATCMASACGFTCRGSFADCDGSAANGCEVNTQSAVNHCGACGRTCPTRRNANSACAGGSCGFTCQANFGDCDGSATTGCETDTRSSLTHCGACGNTCENRPNASRACTGGSCNYTCRTNFGDCDGNGANGCETDTRSSVNHCGGCGMACPNRANADNSCFFGSCRFSCRANFADCDGNDANGCEVNTQTNLNNCGRCGGSCPNRANSSRTCTSGSCGYTCNANFADCDSSRSNGCESNTRTSVSHCGGCGNACPNRANASRFCASGSCGFTCNAGFVDCDGNAANGCEVDSRSDDRNCGACGRSCGASQVCDGSRCVERCPAGRQTSDRADDETGFQVHAIYVLPSDGVDRNLDAAGGPIETSMEAFNRWLSAQTGGSRLRFDTCEGDTDITFVRLDRTGADLAASGIFLRDELEDELQALGFNEPNKLLAVYYDGPNGVACGGAPHPPALVGNVAALYLQGTPPGAPACNTNPIGANVNNPTYIEFAMLHELVHGLGFAVGTSACTPNLNAVSHVDDANDDLMYAGSLPWVLPPRLDVGRNDYYRHGRAGCLDLAQSAFLDPLPAGAVPPPGW